MSSKLERTYRLLLRSYPSEYLDRHEEEILATLLDSSKPAQVRPNFSEATELVIAGFRTRVRLASIRGHGSGWRGALRLAALLLLASVLSDRLASGSDWVALRAAAFVVCAIVAVVLGTRRLGALLVLVALGASLALKPRPELLSLGPQMFVPPDWLYDNAGLLAAAVVLAAASIGQGPRRPWPWWLAGAAIVIPFLYRVFGVDILSTLGVPLSVVELALPVTLLSSTALLLHDPRPSLAATIYAVVHLVKPITLEPDLLILGLPTALDALVLTSVALASTVASARWQAQDLALPNT